MRFACDRHRLLDPVPERRRIPRSDRTSARAFALPARADVPRSPDVSVERFAISAPMRAEIWMLTAPDAG
jgi:hypothetical protein